MSVCSNGAVYIHNVGFLDHEMNSTKVQNPRRKMQVALLAEPKTRSRACLYSTMSTTNEMWWHTMKATALYSIPLHMRV